MGFLIKFKFTRNALQLIINVLHNFNKFCINLINSNFCTVYYLKRKKTPKMINIYCTQCYIFVLYYNNVLHVIVVS